MTTKSHNSALKIALQKEPVTSRNIKTSNASKNPFPKRKGIHKLTALGYSGAEAAAQVAEWGMRGKSTLPANGVVTATNNLTSGDHGSPLGCLRTLARERLQLGVR